MSASPQQTGRLAMIGLDAMELSLIRSSRRDLPNLARALDVGELRRLNSTAELLAGSVWPTFYTGSLPGEHGIYHHLQWDAERMRLRRVAEDWLYAEPFWYELERRGRRVVSIDVPMTFRSRLAHGVEITCWGSHDQLTPFSTRPPQLSTTIRRRYGHHPMGDEIPVEKSAGEREHNRLALVVGAERKAQLSLAMLREHEWDFFLTVFGECHRGGHLLWPEDDAKPYALLDVYRAVDEGVGMLLDAMPKDATVVIFALHGMGPNTSQEHFVPRVMDRLAGNGAADEPSTPARRGAMRFLRETLPASLQNAVARAVPVEVRDLVVSRATTGGNDWPSTEAFALLADLNGYLRFNLRGRERDGILDSGAAAHVACRERLADAFQGLRIAGTDQPLVQAIRYPQEELPGARSHHLPDVVVTWSGAPPADAIASEQLGTITGQIATGRTGNHRPDGFAILLPSGAERGGEAEAGHIADLAPLAMRLMGDGG